ncbi:uncharacterized protein LOC118343436 [Morone saxatilis]|uniref:uncharacterized protein LOC118343436 n=1 Tax=Morone saxatilis TaxID=34816 RepID=UPI0015E21A7E|nr:uncharacterized protein LOC118343436 [Morone saxatilis]
MGSSCTKGQWNGEYERPKRPKHGRRTEKEREEMKKEEEDFVFPFTYDLCDLNDLNEMLNSDESWDFAHVCERAAKLEKIAKKLRKTKPEPPAAATPPPRITYETQQPKTETLNSVVQKIAAHTCTAFVPQLAAALQIGSSEKQMIMNYFTDQVGKQVTALIQLWLDTQNPPSVEKLLAQLKCGGLNYDWLLREEERPRPGPCPPLPAQGSDAPVESVVNPQHRAEEKPERGKEKEEEKPRSVVEKPVCQVEKERRVEPVWTPAELLNLVQSAPNPIIKPRDFHAWLCNVCSAYDLRPADVHKLLEFVYNREWKNVHQNFNIPGADGNTDWQAADAMTTWLDNTCWDSISRCVWQKANFSAVQCCHQKKQEPVTDFLERFQQVWESTLGVDIDSIPPTMTINLLQPHVKAVFEEHCILWSTFNFTKAKHWLLSMESLGGFEPKSKGQRLAGQLGDSGPERLQLEAPPQFRQPRRDKRNDQCFYCGRFGHWARECRAKRQQYSRAHPDAWTWTHTYTEAKTATAVPFQIGYY